MIAFFECLLAALAAFTWWQWLILVGALLTSPIWITLAVGFPYLVLKIAGESVRWSMCLIWTFWAFVFRFCPWQDVIEAFYGWGDE